MDSWHKRRAHQRVYEGLAPPIADRGFRLHKSLSKFVRQIPGGKQHISVALWDYHPEYQFTLTLCFRWDAAEELCHPFAETLPPYYNETLTAMTQLEHLGEVDLPGRGVIYRASTEEELDAVLIPVLRVVTEKVLPFMDRHTDLRTLDAAMNPEIAEYPDRRAFDSSFPPYRGMKAIAVAYLARNPRLEQLITRYQEEMDGLISTERAKFDHLAHHLRNDRPAF